MVRRYWAIYRRPGAVAFCAAASVMRLPSSIYPLGIVLIVSGRDGQYGFAAVLSACYVCGYAVGAPLMAALVDRHGQRRVLVPASVIHGAGVLTLAVLFDAGAPDALLLLPTVVFGFTFMSTTSLVLARWVGLVGGTPDLNTASAAETVLDEMVFIVGPLIATLLALSADPAVVLYACAALRVGGGLWLAALRGTEPRPHPRDDSVRVSPLRSRGMAALIAANIAMGATFASAELAIVAFCGQHGARSLTGIVLATMATGSCVSGVVYGAIRWRADVLHRFQRQALFLAVLPVGLFAATGVPTLAVAGFALGLGAAPIFITVFGLIPQLVPARTLTEGMAWVSAGLNAGAGTGAVLVGGIVDRHGARVAFIVAAAAAAATAALAMSIRPGRAPIADLAAAEPDPACAPSA